MATFIFVIMIMMAGDAASFSQQRVIANVHDKDVTTGWGNTFGRWLFEAAIARCAGTVVYDLLPALDGAAATEFVHGLYSVNTLASLVALPTSLRLFHRKEDLFGAVGIFHDGSAFKIPVDAESLTGGVDLLHIDFTASNGRDMIAVNNDLPETAYDFWTRVCAEDNDNDDGNEQEEDGITTDAAVDDEDKHRQRRKKRTVNWFSKVQVQGARCSHPPMQFPAPSSLLSHSHARALLGRRNLFTKRLASVLPCGDL